jgi:rod shape-determining protein MreC
MLIMTFDYRTAYLVKVRSVLSTTVLPLQYIVDWPIEVVHWMITSVSTHRKLLNENAELQVQQVLLNAQLQKLLSIEKENSQLKGLLQSATKSNSTKVLVAQVLAVDSDPFMHQIVLDRGSSDGVYVGQPVLDTTGVMGQIISVASSTSRVMLLSDTRSAIPVEDSRSGLRGIVIGAGMLSELKLINVPQTGDVQEGDRLLSSGLGLRYPIGYPVGTISHVTRIPSQPFLDIEVHASAYLDRSRLVVLVWPEREQLVKEVDKQLKEMQNEDRALRNTAQRGEQ